jgi:hypothetical protein
MRCRAPLLLLLLQLLQLSERASCLYPESAAAAAGPPSCASWTQGSCLNRADGKLATFTNISGPRSCCECCCCCCCVMPASGQRRRRGEAGELISVGRWSTARRQAVWAHAGVPRLGTVCRCLQRERHQVLRRVRARHPRSLPVQAGRDVQPQQAGAAGTPAGPCAAASKAQARHEAARRAAHRRRRPALPVWRRGARRQRSGLRRPQVCCCSGSLVLVTRPAAL